MGTIFKLSDFEFKGFNYKADSDYWYEAVGGEYSITISWNKKQERRVRIYKKSADEKSLSQPIIKASFPINSRLYLLLPDIDELIFNYLKGALDTILSKPIEPSNTEKAHGENFQSEFLKRVFSEMQYRGKV